MLCFSPENALSVVRARLVSTRTADLGAMAPRIGFGHLKLCPIRQCRWTSDQGKRFPLALLLCYLSPE